MEPPQGGRNHGRFAAATPPAPPAAQGEAQRRAGRPAGRSIRIPDAPPFASVMA